MSVYPFYVSADAEGRRSDIKGGTQYVRGQCIVITNTI